VTGANARWQELSQKDLAPVTMARVMSGPCDLVARVEAALRSLGVTPVNEEPVKASADVAASTASAAYFTAFAICFRFSLLCHKKFHSAPLWEFVYVWYFFFG
jgi:hypothetical protein